MTDAPITLMAAAITIVALLLYMWTGLSVGGMRGKHSVKAPVMTGPDEFERSVRVQMNTLEWIVIFLPLLWLATMYFSPAMSIVYLSWLPAALGIIWIVGRFLYARGYMTAADKRSTGFLISGVALIGLFICAIVGVVMTWMAVGA